MINMFILNECVWFSKILSINIIYVLGTFVVLIVVTLIFFYNIIIILKGVIFDE